MNLFPFQVLILHDETCTGNFKDDERQSLGELLRFAMEIFAVFECRFFEKNAQRCVGFPRWKIENSDAVGELNFRSLLSYATKEGKALKKTNRKSRIEEIRN
jgi:hypothetical protein